MFGLGTYFNLRVMVRAPGRIPDLFLVTILVAIRDAPAGVLDLLSDDGHDLAAGNLIKKVTNNGATTTNYTVDAADRVTGTTADPAGADRVTTVSYTPDDKPATVTQTSSAGATQVTSYTYDPMGNKASQSVLSDNSGHPAGWWTLGQSSGSTVTDSSGSGNTASASGVTWGGSAASFAGTAGQQIVTNTAVLNTTASYSVSAWVNLAKVSGSQTVVGQDGTQNSAFNLQLDATTLGWNFAHNSADTASPTITRAMASTVAVAGTWYHLVGTFDASTNAMDLYVNGSLAGTATSTAPWASSGPLSVGRGKWAGNLSDLVDGQVADVQVYQRVLSSAEVSALYAAGRGGGTTGSSKPLTTSWTLDKRGLPTSMTDPNLNVTSYAYDEAGKQAVVTAPAVSTETGGGTPITAHPVTSYGYDTFGDQTQVQDPNGNITTTAYDGDGHATSQTLPPYTPPGGSASITAPTVSVYDGNGNLTQTTDPLGNVTKYVYDQLGDLATVTAPDTGLTHYTYDTDGQQASATGPTGAQTQATYDFLGRQLTSTVLERYPSAATLTTNYAYTSSAADPGGAWLSGTMTPDGVATSYGYDSLGEKTSVTNGASDKTSYAYDFLGRQVSITAPDGTQQATSYDVLGDPVQVQQLDATGMVLTTRSAAYDGDGNMLSATDARSHATTFSYGATGLLAQEVQPVSATSSVTTSFGYDAAGNQTRYTDGNDSNWITAYNSWNLPQSQVEPATSAYTTAANSTFTTAYDADGRPVAQTLPGGVSVSSGYDQVGRLTSQSGSGADAPTAARSFTYDTAGNMLTAATTAAGASAASSETFTYNDRGEVLTASGTAGSATLGYNGDGLLASRADAAGTTSYAYDNAGRLSGLTDPATGAALAYGYNNDSELTSVSYGTGGDTRSYGYSPLHQLTSDTLTAPGGTVLASVSYGYDPDGNLTSKTTAGLAGAAANTYTYDWANRLASWNNGTTTTSYGYDGNGNRTQAGSATYTYDARDELTSDGTSTYAYTARGTLASTASPAGTAAATADAYGQQLTDGTQSYAYDALGRMTTVTPSPGTAMALSYSGSSDLIASDGTSTYTWTPGGSLTGIGVAGGTASQGVLAMTDQHTDVVADFTPAGTALAGSAAYDPVGNVIATSGAPAGRLGYQSAFTDPVTRKALMGARWYNPATGGFTSRDTQSNSPVPSSAGASPFAYAGDDPMLGIDPTGHSWWSTATSWASDVWNTGTGWVSDAWNAGTSWLSSALDSTASWLGQQLQATQKWLDEQWAEINRVTQEGASWVSDMWASTRHKVRNAAHRVLHDARKVYHAAIRDVRTVYHEVRRVAKEGASWVYHHRAAIVSIAAGVAVFAGCEALTGGAGSVGCAAAAGAAGNLVDYGMSCGSAGGCSVAGAVLSAGTGAIAGVVGGSLAGALGGRLASTVLGDLLPSFAMDGLAGMVSGGAAGAVAGAAGYGAQCARGGDCSWSGLGSAVASGTEYGAAGGGIFGAIGGGIKDLAGGTPEDSGAGGAIVGCGQSFTASTRVLTASGAAVAISTLAKGQKVMALSTRTGKNQAETVTAVLVHYDTDLYDLTVKSRGRTEVIHTTSSHLFWDPYLHQWIASNKLAKGEHLLTANGTVAVADGGTTPKVHEGWMWDLTVPGNNDHDFYVAVAATAVLVHNDVCRVLPSRFGKNTIAVLGRRGDINVARSFSGYEVLSLNRFGKTPWRIWRNDEWVQGIIDKGQTVYLATDIDHPLALFDPESDPKNLYGQTIFAREINQLLEGGYTFSDDGQYMLPPGK